MNKPTTVCRQASEETEFAMSVLNASGGGVRLLLFFNLQSSVQFISLENPEALSMTLGPSPIEN